MADQFRGEVYVTSSIEKERFEQAAYRSGFSVAITLIDDEKYHLVFYLREGKTNGSENK